MKNNILVIGNSVVDVMARPVTPEVFLTGSAAVQETRMSFGGDALNEAVALSRFGKKVQLISKVGRDEAGVRILNFLKDNGISTDSKFDDKGNIVTNGGRVLGVTALGANLKEARANAYGATDWIQFGNKYMCHDIGKAIDEA